MSEKILALIVAFVAGVAASWFIGVRCINVALQHSPGLRRRFSDFLEASSPAPIDSEPALCVCGLPWELCTALAFLDIMCVAATRGEVLNAQHAAFRFLEMLEGYRGHLGAPL